MTTTLPASTASPLTRLAESANSVDWWRNVLRAIGGLQMVYAAALGAAMLIATQTKQMDSLGVLGFLQRDTGIPPSLFGLLFMFGVGVALRGVYPRYESLAVLTGQYAYTLITLIYAVRGEVPLSGLASHGGLCALCVVLIVGATQRHNHPQHRTNVRNVLMPIMGVSLLLYAIGLSTRPDAAINAFITGIYSDWLTAAMSLWLVIGGGYMLFNHILAKLLFVMMTGQYLYTVLALALLAVHPLTTSLAGVASHVGFSVISGFIILIQTDYPG
jgi:hypothetical protein